jgi:hypothetical protein
MKLAGALLVALVCGLSAVGCGDAAPRVLPELSGRSA